jgi:long-chain fatty acid transport protein
MKAFIVFVFAAFALFCVTSPLLAGGIDNKTNYSADYIRSLNRNAATDSADAVVYNPAGVMKMENGMYLELDLQYTALKEATNLIGGVEYESDKTDIVPALFALYKKDQWAAFAAFSIPAGGGSVEFEQGNATTTAIGAGLIENFMGAYDTITNQYLEGKSVYYGYTVGGAYAFNDICSVSLAARYVNAEKEGNGFVTLSGPYPTLYPDSPFAVDYEQDDNGLGFILGLNLTPSEDWNIGLRYESKTGLDLEYTVNTDTLDPLTPDPGGILPPTGFAESRDLPAVFGLGVAYTASPKVRIEADLTYYMNDDADWSDPKFSDVDNGFDLGIALEYTFSPELKGSVGYLLTQTGLDPDGLLPEWPELDAHSFAAGIAYEFNAAWTLNAGLSKTFYGDEITSSGVTLGKDLLLLGVGVQYKY